MIDFIGLCADNLANADILKACVRQQPAACLRHLPAAVLLFPHQLAPCLFSVPHTHRWQQVLP